MSSPFLCLILVTDKPGLCGLVFVHLSREQDRSFGNDMRVSREFFTLGVSRIRAYTGSGA